MLEGLPDFPFRNLERLCLVHGLLPFPVGQWPGPNNAATLALAVGAACGFSLHAFGVTEHRFSRSVRKPGRASRRLYAGCRLVSLRTSSKLIPEEGSPPGFGIA